jgi:hypothetical protein
MNYQTSTLRIPAQSAPVDRAGARTSASGEAVGVEAASWLDDLWGGVKKYGPTVWDIASNL